MKIGYARVSTKEQKLSAQKDALLKAGCKKVIDDKVSGGATSDTLSGYYLLLCAL